MPTSEDIDSQTFIQRWALPLVGAFFALTLGVYFANFYQGLSPKQETWGQFGDFMGGVVNPIVGLCTIWLLTVSLRQNQLALRQAHEELRLAGVALRATEASQIATESALKEQVALAQRSHDMTTTLALWTGLTAEANHLNRRIRDETPGHWVGTPADSPTYPLRIELRLVENQRRMLAEIKDNEIERLISNLEK